jgi:glycosyltransferase involved in cell wall biosynthesis
MTDAVATDTVVFIPAWNEEENLPAVLDGLARELDGVDVLVVDDGSTDRTAEIGREHGANVLSLGSNRGLPTGIAAGYRWALDHGYAYCGRVDADGQHPPSELARLLAIVKRGDCDVAVGSRFVSGDGYEPYRYLPSPARRLGTALLRRAMRIVLRRPFADATSGLYAVNAAALPVLARPFETEAPEVEALIRLNDAGLRVEEVPVRMDPRASGESKLRGSKSLKVVMTVIGTLLAAWLVKSRRSS